jgi:hypothetical protein
MLVVAVFLAALLTLFGTAAALSNQRPAYAVEGATIADGTDWGIVPLGWGYTGLSERKAGGVRITMSDNSTSRWYYGADGEAYTVDITDLTLKFSVNALSHGGRFFISFTDSLSKMPGYDDPKGFSVQFRGGSQNAYWITDYPTAFSLALRNATNAQTFSDVGYTYQDQIGHITASEDPTYPATSILGTEITMTLKESGDGASVLLSVSCADATASITDLVLPKSNFSGLDLTSLSLVIIAGEVTDTANNANAGYNGEDIVYTLHSLTDPNTTAYRTGIAAKMSAVDDYVTAVQVANTDISGNSYTPAAALALLRRRDELDLTGMRRADTYDYTIKKTEADLSAVLAYIVQNFDSYIAGLTVTTPVETLNIAAVRDAIYLADQFQGDELVTHTELLAALRQKVYFYDNPSEAAAYNALVGALNALAAFPGPTVANVAAAHAAYVTAYDLYWAADEGLRALVDAQCLGAFVASVRAQGALRTALYTTAGTNYTPAYRAALSRTESVAGGTQLTLTDMYYGSALLFGDEDKAYTVNLNDFSLKLDLKGVRTYGRFGLMFFADTSKGVGVVGEGRGAHGYALTFRGNGSAYDVAGVLESSAYGQAGNGYLPAADYGKFGNVKSDTGNVLWGEMNIVFKKQANGDIALTVTMGASSATYTFENAFLEMQGMDIAAMSLVFFTGEFGNYNFDTGRGWPLPDYSRLENAGDDIRFTVKQMQGQAETDYVALHGSVTNKVTVYTTAVQSATDALSGGAYADTAARVAGILQALEAKPDLSVLRTVDRSVAQTIVSASDIAPLVAVAKADLATELTPNLFTLTTENIAFYRNVLALYDVLDALEEDVSGQTAGAQRLKDALFLYDNPAVAEVVSSISALPEESALNVLDEAAVQATRAAYNALTPEQKSYVTNYTKLTGLEARLAALKEQKELADAKAAAITAIGSHVDKTAYRVAEKQEIDTIIQTWTQTIGRATTIAGVENAERGAKAALGVVKTDAALTAEETAAFKTVYAAILSKTNQTVTIADEMAITNALAAYAALPAQTQTALSAEQDLLNALKGKVDALKVGAANVAALIAALPIMPTLTDVAAVQAARTDYDALTPEQKELVTNYDALVAAEVRIAALTEEKRAVDAVISKIAALPDPITLADKDAILAARIAYDALIDAQKELVINREKLIEAETALVALEAGVGNGPAEGCASYQSAVNRPGAAAEFSILIGLGMLCIRKRKKIGYC